MQDADILELASQITAMSCRICLVDCKNATRFLFEEIFEQYSHLMGKRLDFGEEEEILPYICLTCFDDLTKAVKFKRLCEGTEVVLKRYIEKQITLEMFGDDGSKKNKHPKKLNESNDGNATEADQVDDSGKNIKRKKAFVMCEICGEQVQVTRIKQHIAVVHNWENRERYTCDICGASYKEKENMSMHMLNRHIGKKYVCECGAEFSTWSGRLCHIRAQHTPESEWKYVCKFCTKRFPTFSRLDCHTAAHIKAKSVVCPVEGCGKVFRTNRCMASHKRNVHSDRQYACEICQKVFTSSKSLRQHKATHFAHSYICPYCPQSFSVGASLRGHMNRQHSEMPLPPAGSKLKNIDLNQILLSSQQ